MAKKVKTAKFKALLIECEGDAETVRQAMGQAGVLLASILSGGDCCSPGSISVELAPSPTPRADRAAGVDAEIER